MLGTRLRTLSANTPNARRLVALAAGLAAVVTLASCGTGQVNQTGSQEAAVDGLSADSKFVLVRDAKIVLSGTGASLVFVAVNTAIHPVTITSTTVSYPTAGQQLVGALSNKTIAGQGRLQVGSPAPVSSEEGSAPLVGSAPAAALSPGRADLVPGRSVGVDFKITAPAAPELGFPAAESYTFHTEVPVVETAKAAAPHE